MTGLRLGVMTYDLFAGRERLMPWRLVLEVAQHMSRQGSEVVVFSATGRSGAATRTDLGGVTVRCIPRFGLQELLARLRERRVQALFWPFAKSSSLRPMSWLRELGIPVIGYTCTGQYEWDSVRATARQVGLKQAARLAVESAVPWRFVAHRMSNNGVSRVICTTEFVRNRLISGRWPADRVYVIPPGKDPVEPHPGSALLEDFQKSWSRDSIYFLFLGPPTPVRGVNVLFRAFAQYCRRVDRGRLVCLFRKDPDSGAELPKDLRFADAPDGRLICIHRNLPHAEVQAFIAHARAVVLPFLYVPCEVPLTVYEAMSYGTPVLATRSAGSRDNLDEAGWGLRPGAANELADAMATIATDDVVYRRLRDAALERIAAHPTWPEVAEQWLNVAGQSVAEKHSRV